MFRGTWNILEHGTWNHVKACSFDHTIFCTAPPPCHVQEASCFPVIQWGTSHVAVADLNDNSEMTEKRALEIVVENYLTSWKEKQTYFQLPTTNPYQQDEESPSFFAMAALYSEISTSMDLNGKHDVVRTEGRPMCLEPIVHCWHLPPFRSSKTPDQWRDTYAQIVLHSVYHTCSN